MHTVYVYTSTTIQHTLYSTPSTTYNIEIVFKLISNPKFYIGMHIVKHEYPLVLPNGTGPGVVPFNFYFPARPAMALTPRDDIDCIIDQVSRQLSSRAD